MERIIIPLDGMEDINEVMSCVRDVQRAETLLGEKIIWGFKVNDALIKYGADIVRRIKGEGFRVFADPKLYDIPNTMYNSIEHLINVGANIISIHCSAMYTPLDEMAPKVAGITILTSMSKDVCDSVYGGNSGYAENSLETKVTSFAIFARECHYGYLVCSAKDLGFLPIMHGTKIITPGIRPEWYQEIDDQKRVMTPIQAIIAGADLLVIGRPILQAKDPIKAILRTNEEIGRAI